jgi:diadenosine tetraphosphate (Ap4A) HIT family hydrolase
MSKCIFCDIVKGSVSSYKIYEDENSLCFLDVKPISRGHCLIIPKSHYENIYDIDENSLKQIIIIAKKVSKLLKKKLGADGVNILHASGETAQQSVLHFHLHLIPRYKSDDLDAWPKSTYQEKSLKGTFKRINE